MYVSVQRSNIASDNDLSPVRRQAIIWTNAAILLMRPQGAYFREIVFKIQKFSFKKMQLTWKCRLGNFGDFLSWPQCVNKSVCLIV